MGSGAVDARLSPDGRVLYVDESATSAVAAFAAPVRNTETRAGDSLAIHRCQSSLSILGFGAVHRRPAAPAAGLLLIPSAVLAALIPFRVAARPWARWAADTSPAQRQRLVAHPASTVITSSRNGPASSPSATQTAASPARIS